jgi:mannose-6-phosphate isomerase-like protein (cupin superfamily)
MANPKDNAVAVATNSPKIPDGVTTLASLPMGGGPGCRVFVHYNAATDQLSGMCTGLAELDPGASPHPIHQHPEEEILIVAEGSGEIICDGKITPVKRGDIMYCAGNVPHGITNTGKVPMTFYWSKWMAKGT